MTWTIVSTEIRKTESGVTNFVDTGLINVPADKAKAVARKEIPCPICGEREDYGRSIRWKLSNEKGETRYDYKPCVCGKLKYLWQERVRAIPPHDRDLTLGGLAPSEKSQLPIEVQKEVIAELKANPSGSYAFIGPAGTSKTSFCVALYVQALYTHIWNNWPVLICDCIWRVSAKTLLDDFVAEATSKEEKNGKRIVPAVNRAKIAKASDAGFKPRLFLEEIDKVRYTEFKINALFEVLDAIYEYNGQLVLNTNLPIPKFSALFGDEAGPAIVRRIGEVCKVINFFPQP